MNIEQIFEVIVQTTELNTKQINNNMTRTLFPISNAMKPFRQFWQQWNANKLKKHQIKFFHAV